MHKHYVYIHKRKSDGSIFYVGKGCGDRKYQKNNRSEWWKRVERKHGRYIEVAQEGMSEDDANLLEMWLIAKFRHEGESLVNISNGGDVQSGWSHSLDSILKIKISNSKPVYSSIGESFYGLRDAVEYLRENGYPKADSSGISMCCHGKLKSAYDRNWSYESVPKHPEEMGRDLQRKSLSRIRSKPVGTCKGEVFDSMTQALSKMEGIGYLDATYHNIKRSIDGKRDLTCGRKWFFIPRNSEPRNSD